MRYFVVFLFLLFSVSSFAQDEAKKEERTPITATIVNSITLLPIENVNVININTVKGAITNSKGVFTIEAKANDTLHVSLIGYESIKVRVTNDWIKTTTTTKIPLTEKAYALEDIRVSICKAF